MIDLEKAPFHSTNETRILTSFEKVSKYHEVFVKAFTDIKNNHLISEQVLLMDGMSGGCYRSFINNLIRNLKDDARYLEIGSWKGSTICSAINNNKCKATCIDNWSEFNGPKIEFLSNIQSFTNKEVDFNFIERSFRDIDYSSIGRYNVYMFDGPHEERDQYDGVVLTQAALDEQYILIVDDWNWPEVRRGTERAIKDLNLEVFESIVVFTESTGQRLVVPRPNQWHNGYYIAVVKKTKS
jgi:hypothetical protein